MFREILDYFLRIEKWFFDSNEKSFINRVESSNFDININEGNEVILVQCVNDFFYYKLFYNVIKNEIKSHKYLFCGISPNLFVLKQEYNFLYLFNKIVSILNFYFINKKWHKLYEVAGLKTIYSLDSINFFKKWQYFIKAIYIWFNLKSKKELLNLYYKNIFVGDLVYDTYLRFRISPTININDPFLCYYIYKSFIAVESCEKLVLKINIAKYFCSYATYIQHGIPIRVFLKHNIDVFSSGNLQQLFKKLSNEDFLQTSNHHSYYNDFLQLGDRESKLKIARDILVSKFNGKIDASISYMKESAFQTDNINISIEKFDGVIFLHDFFDSPHIYKDLIFNDFYEWVNHTLSLISEYGLNIAVKPHPNQISDSKKILDILKSKYKNIVWLDSDISNIAIFNSEIKFGISVYGTILHELAYFGINPICAGDNPHYSFDFVHKPKNICEYDNLILNYEQLKMPDNYKELVEIFFYMHNIHKSDSYSFENLDYQFKNRVYSSSCLNEIV